MRTRRCKNSSASTAHYEADVDPLKRIGPLPSIHLVVTTIGGGLIVCCQIKCMDIYKVALLLPLLQIIRAVSPHHHGIFCNTTFISCHSRSRSLTTASHGRNTRNAAPAAVKCHRSCIAWFFISTQIFLQTYSAIGICFGLACGELHFSMDLVSSCSSRNRSFDSSA